MKGGEKQHSQLVGFWFNFFFFFVCDVCAQWKLRKSARENTTGGSSTRISHSQRENRSNGVFRFCCRVEFNFKRNEMFCINVTSHRKLFHFSLPISSVYMLTFSLERSRQSISWHLSLKGLLQCCSNIAETYRKSSFYFAIANRPPSLSHLVFESNTQQSWQAEMSTALQIILCLFCMTCSLPGLHSWWRKFTWKHCFHVLTSSFN